MIPKKIHYCWFGGAPKSELLQRCIATWKKYCPEFEIKEWNESNFNIDFCQFTKEAYDSKKWAFVSDVARLYALTTEGGIYLDTDVELCKPLTEFLHKKAFTCFTVRCGVVTALFGCEKNNDILSSMLTEYRSRKFIKEDGTYNDIIINEYLERACIKTGFKMNDSFQEINGFAIYPHQWFDPMNHYTLKFDITDDTYAIHYADNSWLSDLQRKKLKEKRKIYQRFGDKWAKRLCRFPGKIMVLFYISIEEWILNLRKEHRENRSNFR